MFVVLKKKDEDSTQWSPAMGFYRDLPLQMSMAGFMSSHYNYRHPLRSIPSETNKNYVIRWDMEVGEAAQAQLSNVYSSSGKGSYIYNSKEIVVKGVKYDPFVIPRTYAYSWYEQSPQYFMDHMTDKPHWLDYKTRHGAVEKAGWHFTHFGVRRDRGPVANQNKTYVITPPSVYKEIANFMGQQALEKRIFEIGRRNGKSENGRYYSGHAGISNLRIVPDEPLPWGACPWAPGGPRFPRDPNASFGVRGETPDAGPWIVGPNGRTELSNGRTLGEVLKDMDAIEMEKPNKEEE